MELKLIHVNKFYKLSNRETFQALQDINVEFDKGELVSIVGESGSGKSTLMNLIGGLDSDFTGGIIAGGQNLGKLTDKELDKYRKNHVGFVFQSFNLISHLTILDNVTLALTLSNVSEKEKVERATTILKRVGLADQLKKKPTQLSGGQKQRVAIARALINDPEIIIADEPTGALDSGTSMQILEILKEIADSGKLVIMVTHSEKVASISSRVVEISDGKIIADRINENYVKNAPSTEEAEQEPKKEESIDQKFAQKTAEKAEAKKTKRNFRNFKEKQNLSLWQAIRLSFHNMWASKTKNILMSIGVAIGIGSLILMMCFSSGITDFIDDTMKSYSDPTIVTIKKSAKSLNEMAKFNPFTDDEIDELINGDGIAEEEGGKIGLNAWLKNKGFNFELTEGKREDGSIDKTNATLTRGLQVMAALFDGKVLYDPENTYHDEGRVPTPKNLEDISQQGAYDSIIYLYTIPPFYSKSNVSEGEMATSKGGVMFTPGIKQMFEKAETKTDIIGAEVKISLTIPGDISKGKESIPLTFIEYKNKETSNLEKIKITGIMDTSVMAGFNVMYVDYDFLYQLFDEKGAGDYFGANALYIQTGNEKIVATINEYLNTYYENEFTGSIEEQLAGMFRSMTSVIGTSLIVISLISLLVSAMMILVVLYMSVTERTKEIGVLKSIGARRKDIRRIFTSESFLVGVLSGICGILFNLLLTLIVVLVLNSTIGLAPITYRWWYFAVGMGVAIFISMLSGLYPANKASKLDPVESLRRE